MHGWATCKECAKGKTREELEKRFDENYEITVIDDYPQSPQMSMGHGQS